MRVKNIDISRHEMVEMPRGDSQRYALRIGIACRGRITVEVREKAMQWRASPPDMALRIRSAACLCSRLCSDVEI